MNKMKKLGAEMSHLKNKLKTNQEKLGAKLEDFENGKNFKDDDGIIENLFNEDISFISNDSIYLHGRICDVCVDIINEKKEEE